MIRLQVILIVLCCSSTVHTQPYFDAVLLRGTISPDAGMWRRNNIPVDYKHYIAGVTIPIRLKDSSRIILGAYTEQWNINAEEIAGMPGSVQSLLLPVTYIKRISDKWNLAATFIPRWNGNNSMGMFENSFQAGGSIIAAYKRTPALTYRVGVYYNSEFFGPFIIPLLGIDWKISSKDNLFGILPQILTYEHRVTSKFSWGAVYRMFNNTYRAGYQDPSGSKTFLRINEIQIALSADYYITKKLVFNLELGHSLFRQLRLGADADKKQYYSQEDVNDNLLVKAGLLYRIRLR